MQRKVRTRGKGDRITEKGHHAPLRDAFTLIELMLVVGVVGLLSLIALPSFAKARQSARVKACVSNLKAMDWAKTEWALELRRADTAIPAAADVIPYLRGGRIPDCPALGTYRLRRVSRTPKCSLYESGHTLNNLNLDEDRAPD